MELLKRYYSKEINMRNLIYNSQLISSLAEKSLLEVSALLGICALFLCCNLSLCLRPHFWSCPCTLLHKKVRPPSQSAPSSLCASRQWCTLPLLQKPFSPLPLFISAQSEQWIPFPSFTFPLALSLR
jgi:hypothetical protein